MWGAAAAGGPPWRWPWARCDPGTGQGLGRGSGARRARAGPTSPSRHCRHVSGGLSQQGAQNRAGCSEEGFSATRCLCPPGSAWDRHGAGATPSPGTRGGPLTSPSLTPQEPGPPVRPPHVPCPPDAAELPGGRLGPGVAEGSGGRRGLRGRVPGRRLGRPRDPSPPPSPHRRALRGERALGPLRQRRVQERRHLREPARRRLPLRVPRRRVRAALLRGDRQELPAPVLRHLPRPEAALPLHRVPHVSRRPRARGSRPPPGRPPRGGGRAGSAWGPFFHSGAVTQAWGPV